ncbi:MAG TPA: hypothetical protein VII63_08465 [Caulobacteraceae bacterium]
MSTANDAGPPVPIPTFAQTLIHSLAQKGLTVVATAAAANGVIQTSQEAQFVSLGVSVALFAASCLWTWARTRIDTARNAALANAPAVHPPVRAG